MSDITVLILNIISASCIVGCCAYITAILDFKNIKPAKALYQKIKGNNEPLNDLLKNWHYLFLIPILFSMLVFILSLISKMSHGQFRIKIDIENVSSVVFWISLLSGSYFFYKRMVNKDKK